MRKLLPFILCLLFIPQLAAAANTPAPVLKGDFTKIKHTSSARVDKVIDATTVLMKDGKIVRLLGIEYPYAPGNDTGDEVMKAKERLAKLLKEGTEVMLYQSRNAKTGRVNRMGHLRAHLVVKKDERWINGTLIAEGLGWAMTDQDVTEMVDQLYAAESAARKAGAGLWAKDSLYPLLTPDNALQGNGTFRVVEGTVAKTASIKNNLYLNFGNDWKKDFTVMITPAVRKSLARRGIDPMAFAGANIRVRGWLREWNGPFMELETAERIEFLSTTPPTPLPTEPSTDAVDKSVGTGQLNP